MNNPFIQRMNRQRKEKRMAEHVITDEEAAMTLAVCLAENDKLGRPVEFHYEWALL